MDKKTFISLMRKSIKYFGDMGTLFILISVAVGFVFGMASGYQFKKTKTIVKQPTEIQCTCSLEEINNILIDYGYETKVNTICNRCLDNLVEAIHGLLHQYMTYSKVVSQNPIRLLDMGKIGEDLFRQEYQGSFIEQEEEENNVD